MITLGQRKNILLSFICLIRLTPSQFLTWDNGATIFECLPSYDTHMTHTNDQEESNVHTKKMSDIFYCFISRVEDKSSVGH